jgi:hypothetical protein
VSEHETDPIFTKWRDQEWLTKYHPRLGDFEKISSTLDIRIQSARALANGARKKVAEISKKLDSLFSNGVPGYVEVKVRALMLEYKDAIKEEIEEQMKVDLAREVKAATREVFQENEEKRLEKQEEQRNKQAEVFSLRKWQIVVIIITGFVGVASSISSAVILYLVLGK